MPPKSQRKAAASPAPAAHARVHWRVSSISNWRYSESEHAAAALFNTPMRPDVFELVWDTQQGAGSAVRSRKERSWEPVSNITGGYASPLVQAFLRDHYVHTQASAAASAHAAAASGTAAPIAAVRRAPKRKATQSDKQAPRRKRGKKAVASAAAASAAAIEPVAAAPAHAAVPNPSAHRASSLPSAAAAPVAAPPVAADSQALTVRRQSSQRLSRSSSVCDVPAAVQISASGAAAASAAAAPAKRERERARSLK